MTNPQSLSELPSPRKPDSLFPSFILASFFPFSPSLHLQSEEYTSESTSNNGMNTLQMRSTRGFVYLFFLFLFFYFFFNFFFFLIFFVFFFLLTWRFCKYCTCPAVVFNFRNIINCFSNTIWRYKSADIRRNSSSSLFLDDIQTEKNIKGWISVAEFRSAKFLVASLYKSR